MLKKKLKIGLIGFGRFGKKYFNNLINSSYFEVEFILKKKQKKSNSPTKIFNDIKQINNIKIDGAIIASPSNTHYNLCRHFLRKNIPLILEKPAVNNFKELKKLLILKRGKMPLLVNHSDLYNPLFQEILKFKKKIGRIKFVKFNFGKFDYQYTVKKRVLPASDWLPHIFATLTNFVSKKFKVKIKHNEHKIIKKSYFQNLKIDVLNENGKFFSEIEFSNFKTNRSIDIYGSNGIMRYDSYNPKKSFVKINNKFFRFNEFKSITPMENLLKKFHYSIVNKKKINDLKIVYKYQKILDQINKRIKLNGVKITKKIL